MSDVVVERIRECEPYRGPHAIPGIEFRPVGKAVGASAWGMNVLEIEAGCEGYPEHDHREDGQEEVYVVLDGSGKLVADRSERALEAGMAVRVGPEVKRKFLPGDDGLVLLAIGGTPGHAYSPPG
ncbi:MAG: cupin domain-containing protein [Acidobacteriota bacterium]